MTLTIRDESPTGESLHELALDFLSERITVRDLIRERIHHEVREFNRKERELVFRGLVQPAEAERVLNGGRAEFRLKQPRALDWEEQFKLAVEGFSNNAFFILVDDKQAEDLEQEFVIGPATAVSFVKLIPLVGG